MKRKLFVLTSAPLLVLPMALTVVSCRSEKPAKTDATLDEIINGININPPSTQRLTIAEIETDFLSGGNFTTSVRSAFGLTIKETNETISVKYPGVLMKYAGRRLESEVGKQSKYEFEIYLSSTAGKSIVKKFEVTSKDRTKAQPNINKQKSLNANIVKNNPTIFKTETALLRTGATEVRTLDWNHEVLQGLEGIEERTFDPSNPEYADTDINVRLDSIAIPSTVKGIGKSAFAGNWLTSVDLTNADSLVVMEENAFKGNAITTLKMDESNVNLTVGLGVFEGAKIAELPEIFANSEKLMEAFKPLEETFKGSAAGSVDAINDVKTVLNEIPGTSKKFISQADYREIETKSSNGNLANLSWANLKTIVKTDNAAIQAAIDDFKFGQYFDKLTFDLVLPDSKPSANQENVKKYSIDFVVNLNGAKTTVSGWTLETKEFTIPSDVETLNASKFVFSERTTQDVLAGLLQYEPETTNDVTNVDLPSMDVINSVLGTSYEPILGALSYKLQLTKKANVYPMGDEFAAEAYEVKIEPVQASGEVDTNVPVRGLTVAFSKGEFQRDFIKFSEGIAKGTPSNRLKLSTATTDIKWAAEFHDGSTQTKTINGWNKFVSFLQFFGNYTDTDTQVTMTAGVREDYPWNSKFKVTTDASTFDETNKVQMIIHGSEDNTTWTELWRHSFIAYYNYSGIGGDGVAQRQLDAFEDMFIHTKFIPSEVPANLATTHAEYRSFRIDGENVRDAKHDAKDYLIGEMILNGDNLKYKVNEVTANTITYEFKTEYSSVSKVITINKAW